MKQANIFLFALAVFSIITIESGARIVNSVTSGNWENSATWGGSTPGCGDTINIGASHNVQITSVLDFSLCASNMYINVSGILSFQTGKKLKLTCSSSIFVNNGGWINSGGGGGNSNLIEICAVTVWNTAMGNLPGPVVLSVNPLPVSLGYFNATSSKEHITLKWVTFTEVNNQCFYLEKSHNGKDYQQIAKIAGAGTSTNPRNYTFKDDAPFHGVQYYRLLQQDIDGKLTTFKPIAIKWENETVLKFYPNPGKGELFASLPESFANQTAHIVVQDMNHGMVVQKDIVLGEKVTGVMVISKTDILKPGNYLVTIVLNEQKFTRLIMIQ